MKTLARNESGTAAVEFGFAVIPFVFITLGIIEVSTILFINSSLEAGLIQASRYAVTGATTPGTAREEKVVEILNTHGFGLVSIEPSNLVTMVYPNFASVGEPEPFTDGNGNGTFDAGEDFTDINGNGGWDSDMGSAGLGGPGDIVVYKVEYQWGLLTELLKPFIGDLTLTGGIAVRNEPY